MSPRCLCAFGRLRGIVERLVRLGWRFGAMDVEFVRRAGDEEDDYFLVEINSRYSYMGDFVHALEVRRVVPCRWRRPAEQTHLALCAFVLCEHMAWYNVWRSRSALP